MDKDALRQEMKKSRREFDKKEEASKKACNFIINMEEYKKAKCIVVYMSAFGEVDTSYIIEDAKKNGKKIAVPISNPLNNTLTISYLTDNLKKGAYGISEPAEKENVPFSEPEFIVVPGICFDKKGGRVGFGKGYYDRFLAAAKGFKAGLCYSIQITDEIDLNPHDIKMDAVVSENGIIRI